MIPEDWVVSTFGDIVDYTKGFAFKSREYKSTGIRIIRVSDTSYDSVLDTDAVYLAEDIAPLYAKWSLREHDLVISTVGSKPPMYDSLVGKVVLIKKSHDGALLNQNAVLIRDKKRRSHIQQLLLNHFRTKRYLSFIKSIFRGNANQASITLKDLFQFGIPLPSNQSEQAAIAAALSDVDALIALLDKLIDKKRDIKKAAMQQLLTGKKRLPGFGDETKPGYKQTEVGVIPEDWDVKKCSELGSFYKGKGISSRDLVTDGLPCIMYGDIYVKFDTKFSNPDFRIAKQTASNSSMARTGDLFFTSSGETAEEIGKCVVYQGNDDIYIGGDIIALTPNSDNDSLFMAYMQNGNMLLSQKAKLGQGHTVVHIYTEHIKSLNMPTPSTKTEQTAIAAVLSDMDAEITALESKRDKTRALKQGMMQELLTGRIRLL